MKRNQSRRSNRGFAGVLASLTFALFTLPMTAGTATNSRGPQATTIQYDQAHEITLAGTIQEVVTKHTKGSPAGMHVLVAGPQGTVDAHLGPRPAKNTLAALRPGAPIRMVGVMRQVNGVNYLLTRQMDVGGRTVQVRSKTGLILRGHSRSASPSRTAKTYRNNLKGGAL